MRLNTNIEIAGEAHPFEVSLGSRFRWEMIMGRPFCLSTSWDFCVYFFCCFVTADEAFMKQDFDAFIEAMEEDTTLEARMFKAYNDLIGTAKKQDGRSEKNSEEDSKKKD